MLDALVLAQLREAAEPEDFFTLEAGRFSVGASDRDDIYLSQVGVSPQHLAFVYVGGLITLLSAQGEVRINGSKLSAFPYDLQPLQVLSLGSAHLSYGVQGSHWPGVPEPVVEETTEVKAPPPPPPPPTKRQQVVKGATRGIAVLGMTMLVTVAALLYGFVLAPYKVVDPGEGADKSAGDEIINIVRSAPTEFGNIKVDRRIDGALIVTGFVETDQSFRLLSDEIRRHDRATGGNVRFDALSKTKVKELVQDMIGNYPLRYEITDDNGQLDIRVTGIRTDGMDEALLHSELGRLKERLAPKRTSYQLELIDANRAKIMVDDILNRSPLTDPFEFYIEKNVATVRGVVAESAELRLRPLMESVEKELSRVFPLRMRIDVEPRVAFVVDSVYLGPTLPSAVISHKGKTETARQGEAAFGVGELTEVRKDGVVVTIGKAQMFVPIER
jgi:hypothetical protein